MLVSTMYIIIIEKKWIVVYSHLFTLKKYIYTKKILHIC